MTVVYCTAEAKTQTRVLLYVYNINILWDIMSQIVNTCGKTPFLRGLWRGNIWYAHGFSCSHHTQRTNLKLRLRCNNWAGSLLCAAPRGCESRDLRQQRAVLSRIKHTVVARVPHITLHRFFESLCCSPKKKWQSHRNYLTNLLLNNARTQQ